jgi:phosphomannomutase
MTYRLEPSILREYDIRGVIGKTLKSDDCYHVGLALGTIMRGRGLRTAVIGFDGRESSPEFAQNVIKGLTETGIAVTLIGLGPSPMVYFAMKHLQTDFAVVVTGSHSPITHNGIKTATAKGPFYGDDVKDVGRVITAGAYQFAKGSLQHFDVKDIYLDALLAEVKFGDEMSAVWDCGNGAAGEIVTKLCQKLPGRHKVLFGEVDGRFPNHHPDPSVAKNLVDLQKTVLAEKAHAGLAFDGDADRFGGVDDKAHILWADVIMAVYAGAILPHHQGASVVADVKSSRVLFDEIARLGGKPIMWKTGHSVIKAKMIDEKAILAGELAGHICFGDSGTFFDGYDDGIYCAIRLLNIIAQSKKALSQLTAHLPRMFNTPEVRFHVDPLRKFHLAPEIEKILKAQGKAGVHVTTIDGVRVTTPDGWWLIRASNTEDVLTIRAESFTEDGLLRLKQQVVDALWQCHVKFSFDDDHGH